MAKDNEYQLTEFSSMELIRAESILRKLDPVRFDEIDYYGMQVSSHDYGKEFEGSKIKKCHFTKCNFVGTSFIGTAGASSSFKKCVLRNCQFKNACFDFTDFSTSLFVDDNLTSYIEASGLAYTNFSDTEFRRMSFNGCNFDSSYLKDTLIINCVFQHCSFENARFENTKFENIDLSQTSIDYSLMRNVTFKNVKLPLSGILHTFGGLQNVESYAEDVIIRFPSSNVEVPFVKIVMKLEDIQAYFFKINDFFTLSTINIFLGNHDLAYQYLGRGLMFSLKYKDFRMIGYFCKLASLNHFFTKDQLQKLYHKLKSEDVVQNMTNHEYYVYLYEMDRIKRLLIDKPFGLPQMKISLLTQIHPEETELATEMLSYLNAALEEYLPQASNYVTLRHNSPFLFEMFLSDSLFSLYNFALIISTSFFGLTTLISKIQKMIYEHYKIEGIKLDNKLKELELERKKYQLNSKVNYRLPAQMSSSVIPSSHIGQKLVSISFSIFTDLELHEKLRNITITQNDH